MIGKFWRLFGSLARRGAIVSHPVVAEVDGLSRVAEDAVGRDLVADAEVACVVADRDARPAVVGDQVARTAAAPPIVLLHEPTDSIVDAATCCRGPRSP